MKEVFYNECGEALAQVLREVVDASALVIQGQAAQGGLGQAWGAQCPQHYSHHRHHPHVHLYVIRFLFLNL